VEKTAVRAALEIASRFPLSHNLCCWQHLAAAKWYSSGKSADPSGFDAKAKEEPFHMGSIHWPDRGCSPLAGLQVITEAIAELKQRLAVAARLPFIVPFSFLICKVMIKDVQRRSSAGG
jgi:hypothetical protein